MFRFELTSAAAIRPPDPFLVVTESLTMSLVVMLTLPPALRLEAATNAFTNGLFVTVACGKLNEPSPPPPPSESALVTPLPVGGAIWRSVVPSGAQRELTPPGSGGVRSRRSWSIKDAEADV